MCENMPVSNRSVGVVVVRVVGVVRSVELGAPRQGARVWVDQGRLVATEAVPAGAFMAQVTQEWGGGDARQTFPTSYSVLCTPSFVSVLCAKKYIWENLPCPPPVHGGGDDEGGAGQQAGDRPARQVLPNPRPPLPQLLQGVFLTGHTKNLEYGFFFL